MPLANEFDYVHGSTTELNGLQVVCTEETFPYMGRDLLVVYAESHKPRGGSNFLVLIPGFIVNRNHSVNTDCSPISKIQKIPDDMGDAVIAFLKSQGLERRILILD